ncbi:MAG: biotin--[acetyl-CoA-carboxylase] ligase [Dysgonomonas sp.]
MNNYLLHISETDSTNTFLKNLAKEQNLPEGYTVLADFQTAGRGQRGNSWESEDGENLLFSMILYPRQVEIKEQFILSQVVSVSILEVLSKYSDSISVKWPNDIYWKDKKICGFIIENNLMDDAIESSIIGIGININQACFKSDAPNPVSLNQVTGQEHNRIDILDDIHKTIFRYYKSVSTKKEQIADFYKGNLYRQDGFFPYSDTRGSFMARIKDVESDGHLILETEAGEARRYAFKEVRYL